MLTATLTATPNLAAILGPCATVKPTTAAAAAIRKAVLRPRDNYPKSSMQSAPRCLDGVDPYLFALFHGIVTEKELRPFLERWRDDEDANRGLGSGAAWPVGIWIDAEHPNGWFNEQGDAVPITVHDCQHETMQQYTTNRDVLGDAVSIQAPTDLVNVIAAEKLVTDPKCNITNPREHFRPIIALLQEGSPLALTTAQTIFGKVQAKTGKKNGLAFYMLAPLKADHADLPINAQQQSLGLKAYALGYQKWPLPVFRDGMYLGLEMMAALQMPDGSFANDAGWDEAGNIVLSEPGDVMDLWAASNIIAAKHALGALWPPKAQKMLDRAKALWLATGYTKPSSSSFGIHNVLSITLGVSPEWGFRA